MVGMNGLNAYRAPSVIRATRNAKRRSPAPAPAPAPFSVPAPPLNLSYVNERNTSGEGRRIFNSNILNYAQLTNNQKIARRNATLKMVRGDTPSNTEKLAAGILSKENYKVRRYNATLKNVSRKILNFKRSKIGNGPEMRKPPYTHKEGNILGRETIKKLYRDIKA